MAIDRGDNVQVNFLLAVIAMWLNASLRSRVRVRNEQVCQEANCKAL